MITPTLVFTNRSQAVKATGLSYIGGVSTSAKIVKNEKKNVLTYIIYLAPASKSGYNVCPKATAGCIAACLDESGHNKIDVKEFRIDKARIKKTKMFFENRAFFMAWVYEEIKAYKAQALRKGMEFSVRLNGTSDLAPNTMVHNGKTLFELFPDVQFYDYTKVLNRTKLTKAYDNYDLTFSYSGENWLECEAALADNVRIAMVFEKRLPKTYMGIPVINADATDLRYLEPGNVICGLSHKKTRKKIDYASQKFIISDTDKNCQY